MNAGWVISTVFAALVGGIVSHFATRQPWWGHLWFGACMVASVAITAWAAAQRNWGLAAWMAACAIANGLQWWKCRKRRKRRRAAALIGAKSRARLAKLVQRAREAVKPRPVRQPAPGNAP